MSRLKFVFTPEGLSNAELEKLAEVGTAAALEMLHQALSAHEKKLVEIRNRKQGGAH